MSENVATLTTEQAAERIVDIIEGRDGQMAIDMTLASDRDMAYNLNTIIEFRLRTLLGACPPPSDVRNRHEAYGIAAENFCQVNASVKKIRGDMNLLLTTLGDPNRPALEAVGSLLNSATLAALDVITMAAEMKRAMTDLYAAERSEPTPLEELAGEAAGFEEAEEDEDYDTDYDMTEEK